MKQMIYIVVEIHPRGYTERRGIFRDLKDAQLRLAELRDLADKLDNDLKYTIEEDFLK